MKRVPQTHIRIDTELKEKLEALRDRTKLTSMNDVIDALLSSHRDNIQRCMKNPQVMIREVG